MIGVQWKTNNFKDLNHVLVPPWGQKMPYLYEHSLKTTKIKNRNTEADCTSFHNEPSMICMKLRDDRIIDEPNFYILAQYGSGS